MFSLFRRSLPQTEEVRDPLRLPIRDSEALLAELHVEGLPPVAVELIDLSVAGVTLLVAFHDDPGLAVDDVAHLRIESATGDWSIESRVQVYDRVREELGAEGLPIFQYGFDFVNEGNLFAQIDQAAGRWFNRRRNPRARPELDRQPTVALAYKHYRSTGTIYDLSIGGLCVALDTMAAAPFRMGDPIEMTFGLPGIRRPFEGRGVLRHARRQSGRAYVGIEFELDRTTVLGRRHAELCTYVERRLETMAAFGRSVTAGAR